MSEDAWLHRAAPDEDTQPQIARSGDGVTEDVAHNAQSGDVTAGAPDPGKAPAEPVARPPRAELPQTELPSTDPTRTDLTRSDLPLDDARTGDSPDLLRWRAEMLLDEMMVGAVDASAGDLGGSYRPNPLVEHDLRSSEPWESATRESGARMATAQRTPRAPRPIASPGSGGEAAIPARTGSAAENGVSSSGTQGTHGAALNGQLAGKPAANGASHAASVAQGSAEAAGGVLNGRNRSAHRPAGDEADSTAGPVPGPAPMPPYQPASVSRLTPHTSPAASGQETRASSKTPRRVAGRDEGSAAPALPYSAKPALPTDRHPYDDEPPRKLTAVEQRYPRPAPRRVEPAAPPLSNGRHADDANGDAGYAPGLGPIRRNPAVIRHDPVAGAMSVGPTAGRHSSKYAQLLPRSAPWDEHEMMREIASLADEMARVLPSGHESSRRARHLLEKAQTIFASDPLRSAEVDYYLAQVRAIVQRSRQTVQWSGLYRKRLVLYHVAWLLFSGLIVLAGVLYGDAMAATLGAWFGWGAGGFAARSFVPVLIAVCGGGLGGALGGLLNLRAYHRRELGYVDRKYSLRGLILPLMGMLAGFVLAGVVAGVVALAGYDGSWPLWLVLGPATIAFAAGLLQESIYGTRE